MKIKIVLAICVIFSFEFFTQVNADENIRKPIAAGSFYPLEKEKLSGLVNEFLNKVPKQTLDGKLIAVMVPHAGYIFSGQVAAYSYKQFQNQKIDTVILLGSSHNYFFKKAAVYDNGYFSSPLGNIKINESLSGKIIHSSKFIEANKEVHSPEHSLEVQLPFLQTVLKNFEIVPILIGNMELDDFDEVSNGIVSCLKNKENVLLVISTDMSHYPSYKDANAVDNALLHTIENLDYISLNELNNRILSEQVSQLECLLCGKNAVITGMMISQKLGANKATVLKYANSGDFGGEKTKVVGYGAVAFTQDSKLKIEDYKIDKKMQNELLSIAKKSINNYLQNNNLPKISGMLPESSFLYARGAAFVTLKIKGELRGCVGRTSAVEPLFLTVSNMSIAAGFQDYRFSPLTKKEFDKINIEISVLSPLKRIKDTKEIIMGTHGVIVKKNNHYGIFLPQVANETGWDKERFLKELCSQKANLPADAWKDKETEIYIFTVIHFNKDVKDIK